VQANAFCFDGDAALALEIHRVKDLFVHFALRQRAGHFEQAVSERGFAVVDMRDDAEIPYELRVHFSRLPIFSIAGRMRMVRPIFRRACCFRTSDTRSEKPCRMNIQFATSAAARQQGGRGEPMEEKRVDSKDLTPRNSDRRIVRRRRCVVQTKVEEKRRQAAALQSDRVGDAIGSREGNGFR